MVEVMGLRSEESFWWCYFLFLLSAREPWEIQRGCHLPGDQNQIPGWSRPGMHGPKVKDTDSEADTDAEGRKERKQSWPGERWRGLYRTGPSLIRSFIWINSSFQSIFRVWLQAWSRLIEIGKVFQFSSGCRWLGAQSEAEMIGLEEQTDYKFA